MSSQGTRSSSAAAAQQEVLFCAVSNPPTHQRVKNRKCSVPNPSTGFLKKANERNVMKFGTSPSPTLNQQGFVSPTSSGSEDMGSEEAAEEPVCLQGVRFGHILL